MKSVFITRDLEADSPFKVILENAGFEVSGQSLIEFSPLPFNEIPQVDWIFFYSKNAVQYFFAELKKIGLELPTIIKLATIGSKTGDYLKKVFQNPDFIGNGQPKETAIAFLKIAAGKNILFPRAEKSTKSIQQLIENQAFIHDLVVYRNKKKKNSEPIQSDIVAFTSPLNVEAYFENVSTRTKQDYFVIGKTTAKALLKKGIKVFQTAPSPSEKDLAETIIKSVISQG